MYNDYDTQTNTSSHLAFLMSSQGRKRRLGYLQCAVNNLITVRDRDEE